MKQTTDILDGRMRQVGVGLPVPDEGSAPLALGLNAVNLRYIKIPLATARDHARIEIAGNVLACWNSSAPLAYGKVSLKEENRDEFVVREGFQLRGVPFNHITLSNSAQPDQYLGLLVVRHPNPGFDLILPPQIREEMFMTSGMQWSGRIPISAVVGERGTIALINNIGSGKIGLILQAKGNVTVWGGMLPMTNAAIEAEVNMATQNMGAQFNNWIPADITKMPLNQCAVWGGTLATVLAGRGRYYDANTAVAVTGRETNWRGMLPVMPGWHFAIQAGSDNTGITYYWMHAEIPIDLWGN